MTDTSRFENWIYDYFDEPDYTRDDVDEWANENVPVWKDWSETQKERMLDDYDNLRAEAEIKEIRARETPTDILGRSRETLKDWYKSLRV